jgi:signal transduction histidine kinase
VNCDTHRSANVMIGATAGAPELVEWAGEWIKKWFRPVNHPELTREVSIRLDERLRERARIARDLHDTLLQGVLGLSMQLYAAVGQVPEESAGKSSLNHAVLRMQRIVNEARDILQGLRSSSMASMSLEQALSCLQEEFAPGGGARFRIFITGQPKPLKPAVQEQIYLIGREALINALRHSEATSIEAEIEYLPRQLRVLVRDNGCGMDSSVVASGRQAHCGLVGMRERAAVIGAQFRIWSRLGAGTEVEISLPGRVLAEAYA